LSKRLNLDTRARHVRVAFVLSASVALPVVTMAARQPVKAATRTVVARRTAVSAAAAGLAPGGWDHASLGTIDRNVFHLALGAATCAVQSGTVAGPSTLTVIDYSKPSTARRLWVFDLRSHELLYEELVAHGQGSGDNVARAFSNEPETHRSSLGLFEAENTYVGKNGYSLRLKGLDAGFNDKALERAIVMHGAPYVSEAFARAHGRIGRSWGCPALPEAVARDVIDRVKDSGLVFAYYPDQRWLAGSKYLGGCTNAA
jgi:L,D-transpeptidase catalytic domain